MYSFNISRSSVVWEGLTLSWYNELFKDRDLFSSLFISLKVAFLSAAISAVIGTLGAIAVKRLHKAAKALVLGLSYVPLIIPEIVFAIALLMFFSWLPINYGISTLVISHTAFCIPYVLFMVQIRLNSIDPSINEAARDLGAKKYQLFFTVTLPLILPAIVSGTFLAIAMSLDDVVISFFVSGPGTQTLPVKVFSMLRLGITPKINALCTLLLLFTFLLLGITMEFERRKSLREEESE